MNRTRHNFCSLIALIALVCLVVAGVAGATTAIDGLKATKVKAAYLYHLVRLVAWPTSGFASDEAPLIVTFVGPDTHGLAVYFQNNVPATAIGGHSLFVRSVAAVRDLQGVDPGHIVFFTASDEPSGAVLAQLDLPPQVLSAGDAPDFCAAGGMVGFILIDGRIRVEYNSEALARTRLKLSAEFLQHARVVNAGAGTED